MKKNGLKVISLIMAIIMLCTSANLSFAKDMGGDKQVSNVIEDLMDEHGITTNEALEVYDNISNHNMTTDDALLLLNKLASDNKEADHFGNVWTPVLIIRSTDGNDYYYHEGEDGEDAYFTIGANGSEVSVEEININNGDKIVINITVDNPSGQVVLGKDGVADSYTISYSESFKDFLVNNEIYAPPINIGSSSVPLYTSETIDPSEYYEDSVDLVLTLNNSEEAEEALNEFSVQSLSITVQGDISKTTTGSKEVIVIIDDSGNEISFVIDPATTAVSKELAYILRDNGSGYVQEDNETNIENKDILVYEIKTTLNYKGDEKDLYHINSVSDKMPIDTSILDDAFVKDNSSYSTTEEFLEALVTDGKIENEEEVSSFLGEDGYTKWIQDSINENTYTKTFDDIDQPTLAGGYNNYNKYQYTNLNNGQNERIDYMFTTLDITPYNGMDITNVATSDTVKGTDTDTATPGFSIDTFAIEKKIVYILRDDRALIGNGVDDQSTVSNIIPGDFLVYKIDTSVITASDTSSHHIDEVTDEMAKGLTFVDDSNIKGIDENDFRGDSYETVDELLTAYNDDKDEIENIDYSINGDGLTDDGYDDWDYVGSEYIKNLDGVTVADPIDATQVTELTMSNDIRTDYVLAYVEDADDDTDGYIHSGIEEAYKNIATADVGGAKALVSSDLTDEVTPIIEDVNAEFNKDYLQAFNSETGDIVNSGDVAVGDYLLYRMVIKLSSDNGANYPIKSVTDHIPGGLKYVEGSEVDNLDSFDISDDNYAGIDIDKDEIINSIVGVEEGDPEDGYGKWVSSGTDEDGYKLYTKYLTDRTDGNDEPINIVLKEGELYRVDYILVELKNPEDTTANRVTVEMEDSQANGNGGEAPSIDIITAPIFNVNKQKAVTYRKGDNGTWYALQPIETAFNVGDIIIYEMTTTIDEKNSPTGSYLIDSITDTLPNTLSIYNDIDELENIIGIANYEIVGGKPDIDANAVFTSITGKVYENGEATSTDASTAGPWIEDGANQYTKIIAKNGEYTNGSNEKLQEVQIEEFEFYNEDTDSDFVTRKDYMAVEIVGNTGGTTNSVTVNVDGKEETDTDDYSTYINNYDLALTTTITKSYESNGDERFDISEKPSSYIQVYDDDIIKVQYEVTNQGSLSVKDTLIRMYVPSGYELITPDELTVNDNNYSSIYNNIEYKETIEKNDDNGIWDDLDAYELNLTADSLGEGKSYPLEQSYIYLKYTYGTNNGREVVPELYVAGEIVNSIALNPTKGLVDENPNENKEYKVLDSDSVSAYESISIDEGIAQNLKVYDGNGDLGDLVPVTEYTNNNSNAKEERHDIYQVSKPRPIDSASGNGYYTADDDDYINSNTNDEDDFDFDFVGPVVPVYEEEELLTKGSMKEGEEDDEDKDEITPDTIKEMWGKMYGNENYAEDNNLYYASSDDSGNIVFTGNNDYVFYEIWANTDGSKDAFEGNGTIVRDYLPDSMDLITNSNGEYAYFVDRIGGTPTYIDYENNTYYIDYGNDINNEAINILHGNNTVNQKYGAEATFDNNDDSTLTLTLSKDLADDEFTENNVSDVMDGTEVRGHFAYRIVLAVKPNNTMIVDQEYKNKAEIEYSDVNYVIEEDTSATYNTFSNSTYTKKYIVDNGIDVTEDMTPDVEYNADGTIEKVNVDYKVTYSVKGSAGFVDLSIIDKLEGNLGDDVDKAVYDIIDNMEITGKVGGDFNSTYTDIEGGIEYTSDSGGILTEESTDTVGVYYNGSKDNLPSDVDKVNTINNLADGEIYFTNISDNPVDENRLYSFEFTVSYYGPDANTDEVFSPGDIISNTISGNKVETIIPMELNIVKTSSVTGEPITDENMQSAKFVLYYKNQTGTGIGEVVKNTDGEDVVYQYDEDSDEFIYNQKFIPEDSFSEDFEGEVWHLYLVEANSPVGYEGTGLQIPIEVTRDSDSYSVSDAEDSVLFETNSIDYKVSSADNGVTLELENIDSTTLNPVTLKITKTNMDGTEDLEAEFMPYIITSEGERIALSREPLNTATNNVFRFYPYIIPPTTTDPNEWDLVLVETKAPDGYYGYAEDANENPTATIEIPITIVENNNGGYDVSDDSDDSAKVDNDGVKGYDYTYEVEDGIITTGNVTVADREQRTITLTKVDKETNIPLVATFELYEAKEVFGSLIKGDKIAEFTTTTTEPVTFTFEPDNVENEMYYVLSETVFPQGYNPEEITKDIEFYVTNYDGLNMNLYNPVEDDEFVTIDNTNDEINLGNITVKNELPAGLVPVYITKADMDQDIKLDATFDVYLDKNNDNELDEGDELVTSVQSNSLYIFDPDTVTPTEGSNIWNMLLVESDAPTGYYGDYEGQEVVMPFKIELTNTEGFKVSANPHSSNDGFSYEVNDNGLITISVEDKRIVEPVTIEIRKYDYDTNRDGLKATFTVYEALLDENGELQEDEYGNYAHQSSPITDANGDPIEISTANNPSFTYYPDDLSVYADRDEYLILEEVTPPVGYYGGNDYYKIQVPIKLSIDSNGQLSITSNSEDDFENIDWVEVDINNDFLIDYSYLFTNFNNNAIIRVANVRLPDDAMFAVKKVDMDDNTIENLDAEFKIYLPQMNGEDFVLDENGNIVYSSDALTNKDGEEIVISTAKEVSYVYDIDGIEEETSQIVVLEETMSPYGYVDGGEDYKVQIPLRITINADGTAVLEAVDFRIDVNNDGKDDYDYSVSTEDNTTLVTIENTLLPDDRKIIIHKVSLENDELILDAEFKVYEAILNDDGNYEYDKYDNIIHEDEALQDEYGNDLVISTEDSAEFIFDPDGLVINKEYILILEETKAPSGYYGGSSRYKIQIPVKITVDENGEMTVKSLDYYTGEEYTGIYERDITNDKEIDYSYFVGSILNRTAIIISDKKVEDETDNSGESGSPKPPIGVVDPDPSESPEVTDPTTEPSETVAPTEPTDSPTEIPTEEPVTTEEPIVTPTEAPIIQPPDPIDPEIELPKPSYPYDPSFPGGYIVTPDGEGNLLIYDEDGLPYGYIPGSLPDDYIIDFDDIIPFGHYTDNPTTGDSGYTEILILIGVICLGGVIVLLRKKIKKDDE